MPSAGELPSPDDHGRDHSSYEHHDQFDDEHDKAHHHDKHHKAHHYDQLDDDTTVAPTTTTEPSGTWWVPGKGAIEWQWELDHALQRPAQPPTWATTTRPTPGRRPPIPRSMTSTASTTPLQHRERACTLWGTRSCATSRPATWATTTAPATRASRPRYYAQFSAAGDLGAKQSGYPEYYLNINAPSTLAVIEAMIKQQCSAKGFDAVETDNDETWQYSTGFSISEANDETYMTSIANYIHSLGMAWVIKNCDDVGNTELLQCHVPAWPMPSISEQCNQYGTCSDLGNFLGQQGHLQRRVHRRGQQSEHYSHASGHRLLLV